MTKEEWDVIGNVLEAILLRFKSCELEIEKLKFEVKQLEQKNNNNCNCHSSMYNKSTHQESE